MGGGRGCLLTQRKCLSAAELAELTALGYTARAIMAGSTLDDIVKEVWVSE